MKAHINIQEDDELRKELRELVMGMARGIARDELAQEIKLEVERKVNQLSEKHILNIVEKIIREDKEFGVKVQESVKKYFNALDAEYEERARGWMDRLFNLDLTERVNKMLETVKIRVS